MEELLSNIELHIRDCTSYTKHPIIKTFKRSERSRIPPLESFWCKVLILTLLESMHTNMLITRPPLMAYIISSCVVPVFTSLEKVNNS